MATLSETDRRRIWRGLMRYWSRVREPTVVSKGELQAAVDATDAWIDANQGSYNQALPVAARDGLSAAQKTLLFCCVALMRVSPGVAKLLQRALGVEVD